VCSFEHSGRVDTGVGTAHAGRETVFAVECDVDVDSEGVADDELTALALAADPDQPVDPDAVPISLGGVAPGLLPEWYMPAPMSTGGGSARRWVLGGIVVILVAMNGAGLCVTNGVPEIAW
jgi:hypothetical protein